MKNCFIFLLLSGLFILNIPDLYSQTVDISLPSVTLNQVIDSLQASLTPADTSEGGKEDAINYFILDWSGNCQ